MQAPKTTHRPTFRYSSFYKDCANTPELPKFRRLAAQWTKKLYDDLEELLKKERDLDQAIAIAYPRSNASPLTFLDCPRAIVENEELLGQWSDYNGLLRLYAQDLCLFNQLFKLPDHSSWFSRRFAEYNKLFQDGNFGPTDEKGAAADYRNFKARDFVAGVGVDSFDVLTDFCADNARWIEHHLLERVVNLFGRGRPSQHADHLGIERGTIIKVIDALTCIFVPLLLTATMFALALTQRLLVRIAVVGALGLAFAVSAKLIAGRLSRGEIFAFTAAFFAVASVFVSTTDVTISKAS